MRDRLRNVIRCLENNFYFPITLWVDFEYKHYVLTKHKKRVGYLFKWADFKDYPSFNNIEDIPEIRLPVRDGHYSFNDILGSFFEVVFCYIKWLMNEPIEVSESDEKAVDYLIEQYLLYEKTKNHVR